MGKKIRKILLLEDKWNRTSLCESGLIGEKIEGGEDEEERMVAKELRASMAIAESAEGF